MKIRHYILFSLLAAFTAACTDEVDYKPADPETGPQVYFDKNIPAQIDLDDEATSFNVGMYRVVTEGSVTVTLKATDESGLFTIPASVTFPDGQANANVAIGYDATTLDYDDYKPLTLAIADEAQATAYGLNNVAFKAGRPSPFESIGVGKFYDSFWYEDEWKQEILINTVTNVDYRLPDCFAEGYPIDFSIDEEGKVTAPRVQVTGIVHSTYGMLYAYFGSGKFEDGVLTLNLFFGLADGRGFGYFDEVLTFPKK